MRNPFRSKRGREVGRYAVKYFPDALQVTAKVRPPEGRTWSAEQHQLHYARMLILLTGVNCYRLSPRIDPETGPNPGARMVWGLKALFDLEASLTWDEDGWTDWSTCGWADHETGGFRDGGTLNERWLDAQGLRGIPPSVFDPSVADGCLALIAAAVDAGEPVGPIVRDGVGQVLAAYARESFPVTYDDAFELTATCLPPQLR